MAATKNGAIRAFITPYYVCESAAKERNSLWTSDPNHSRRCQVSEFSDRPKRQSAGSQQVRYTGVCMYVREAYQ